MQAKDLLLALISGLILAGFFVFANFLTRIYKGVDGFGLGDIQLAPSLGLILGWPKILPGIFFSFIVGSVIGILLIIIGKKKLGDYLPFGPFLIAGTIFGLVWGESLWNLYVGFLV